jgi:glycosyltransferase involved in cell wall biosynthesis
MLEYLRHRFELDAIHFRVRGQPDPVAAYPEGMLRRVHRIDLPPHSKAFLPRLLRNLRRAIRGVSPLVDRFTIAETALTGFLEGQNYDLAWCEHFWTAPYAPLLRRHARKLVLNLHNVESNYFRTAAAAAPLRERWMLERFAAASLRKEREVLRHFDFALACSAVDRGSLPVSPGLRTAIIPNAIPAPSRSYPPPQESIAFSGNFAYAPNRQGAAWFAQSVWPQLFLTQRQLRLRVIGKEAELVRPLFSSLERVDIVGPTADAVEEIAKSKVAIAPLFFGSGTRLKILEAWAAGSAVVSTALGAEGLDAQPGAQLAVAEEPEAFRVAIVEFLQNEALRATTVQAAKDLLRRRFTWEAAHNLLEDSDL